MRKTAKILQAFVVVYALSLMTNCTTNEITDNKNADASNKAKSWFESHKNDYNSTILQYIENLDWENVIVSNGEEGEVIEVPFTIEDNLKASNENAFLHNDHHRLMFLKDQSNEYKIYYVQIFSNKEESKILDKDYNYYSIKSNFSGKVFVQDLSSNVGSKLEFENGIEIISSLTGKMREQAIDCVWLGYWHEDGHFEPIKLIYCEGGSGDTSDPKPQPGYGGSGGTNPSKPTAPVVKVITDASFLNNPCLASVFSKLGGSTIFQKYLSNFDGNFSVANLKLSASNNISNSVNAETSPPLNYVIDISFNTNNLNRPGLDIARTFMHEMIHAEMFRKLLSLSSTKGEIDVSKLNQMLTQHNYPGLYDYYTRYGVNGMQHEQMAAHYMNTIVSFLKGYDSGLTQSQYEAIAWAGLKGTTSWNALTDAKKQSIIDTYNSWLSTAGKQCN